MARIHKSRHIFICIMFLHPVSLQEMRVGPGWEGKRDGKGFFVFYSLFLLALQEWLSLMLLIYCADSVALVRCCNGRCRGAWQTAALSLHVCDCVCVRLRESKAANRESLCISSMSVGLLGDLKKTGFLSSLTLSLSLFLSLALSLSLSPLGLCYANAEGCSGFIVIFHLASDER